MKKVNVNALFLGPKSENEAFFKDMLNFMINDHVEWRKYFHPNDEPYVSREEINSRDYQATLNRTLEALVDLTAKLQHSSMPWFSPRYLGHMANDTIMAADLGYMLSLLYNPNNCAYEASPATTPMEIEVGKQLAALMGYEPDRAWGHITSGGTVANYEGMWVARNLKSVPFALKEAMPELVEGMDDWTLSNLPSDQILDLMDRAKEAGRMEAIRKESVRGKGVAGARLGKWLVPQSKHYSWTKAADILGIGQENLVSIRVTENYRMDLDHLRETIDRLVTEKSPILGLVAVVGTTEEGAIDELQRIVSLRREYRERGVWFYLHIDAAYGGDARSVFLDENGAFMSLDTLRRVLHDGRIMDRECGWPSEEVHGAFEAMSEADSITVDPHKMGYIPYAAGAVLMRDRRVLDLISYFAAYVFEETEKNPMLLGSYILEGSKAGAAVAAVWTAHRVVPLDITGYGRLIGRSIEGAHHFHHSLMTAGSFDIEGRSIEVHPLTKPDFNIVVFAFNERGNKDLKAMNDLNQKIYESCSYKSGPVYTNDFITSKTALSREEYGETPGEFAARFGIPKEEWDRHGEVFVLRSCVLTPLLARNTSYREYWDRFMNTMREKIGGIFREEE